MEKVTERLALFWLGICGASTKKLNAILNVYSPLEIWENFSHEQFKKALGDSVYKELKNTHKIDFLEERLYKLSKKRISVVTRIDEEFSFPLAQKEVNPPLLLYCIGEIGLLRSDCVALVGTRKATRYGKDATQKLVRELVSGGLTIVSGLAEGIDTYAHTQALDSEGKTIAVLGGGFEHIYPQANIPLAKRIISNGGLLACEYPPEFECTRYSFPDRNRIISGLSSGVIVVESGIKGGALITAEYALEQGRELFVVPGNITSPMSEGTNELLLSGNCNITLSGKQVFEALKMTIPTLKKNTVSGLDIFEQKVYDLLQVESRPFDEILIETGLPMGELTAILSKMELKSIIRRLPSNYFCRT